MRTVTAVILATSLSIFSTFGPALAGGDKNLFIMGWDGTGLRNIRPLLNQGRLPNLKALLDSNCVMVPLEIHTSTLTVPCWTVFFTAMDYDVTQACGNKRFDAQYGISMISHYGLDLWLTSLPYSYSVVQPIQEAGYSIGWYASKTFLGSAPYDSPLSEVAENADDFFQAMPLPTDWGDAYLDELTSRSIRFIRNASNPFLVFLLTNPDYYGHKHGENGDRYLEEFERSDEKLGKILPFLGNDTHIIILTDHGFDEGKTTHRNAPDCWMVTNLPVHSAYVNQSNQKAFASYRDVLFSYLKMKGLPVNDFMRGKNIFK